MHEQASRVIELKAALGKPTRGADPTAPEHRAASDGILTRELHALRGTAYEFFESVLPPTISDALLRRLGVTRKSKG